MRAFQAQHELPTLARAQPTRIQMRAFTVIGFGIDGARKPNQLNMMRHMGVRREHLFDIELEAHAALGKLRQRGHHADHLDVLALPRLRQRIGQAPGGKTSSPEITGGKGGAEK